MSDVVAARVRRRTEVSRCPAALARMNRIFRARSGTLVPHRDSRTPVTWRQRYECHWPVREARRNQGLGDSGNGRKLVGWPSMKCVIPRARRKKGCARDDATRNDETPQSSHSWPLHAGSNFGQRSVDKDADGLLRSAFSPVSMRLFADPITLILDSLVTIGRAHSFLASNIRNCQHAN